MPKRGTNLAQYSEYLGLGIQIAAAMVVPLLLGGWLDRKFGLFPWLTVVGALFGILNLFAITLKLAITANKKNEESKKNRERDQKGNRDV